MPPHLRQILDTLGIRDDHAPVARPVRKGWPKATKPKLDDDGQPEF